MTGLVQCERDPGFAADGSSQGLAEHGPDLRRIDGTAQHDLHADLITTREDLDGIVSEWNPLLEGSRACTIFLTWEWISAWLEAVRPDAQPLVVVVRDAEGTLAGIGPFYRTTFRFLKLLRRKWLRVLGDSRSGSEYVNIIARQDAEREATCAILDHLARNRKVWDAIWLPNMGPSEKPCASLKAACRVSGFRSCSRPAQFARIKLPGSFDDYLLGLPQKIRYQMRRGLERLEDDCGAALVTCESTEQLDPSLEELFRLHRARWTPRGEAGVFARPGMCAFYKALGPPMLKRGWLRLDTLQVEAKVVAAQIGFAYRGVFYELQRGFDPSFPNIPAGLGAALRNMIIRRCINDGIRIYDFLGGYNTDKGRAGAELCCGDDLMVVRPSLWNDLLLRANVWPTGRFLVPQHR